MGGTKKIHRVLRLPLHTQAGSTKAPAPISEHAGLVDMFCIIQQLQVPLLPLSSERGLQIVGRGLSGEIEQARANATTMLAFKDGIPSKTERDSSSSQDWYSLITELTILQHPQIRNSIWFIDLIGMSFRAEVNSFGPTRVWPVLVTPKSSLADLEVTITDQEGHPATPEQRLSWFLDITKAVHTLHRCGVAHGDIKPQNFLLTVRKNEIPTCIMLDFGSSVIRGQRREPTISEPWNAPELAGRAGHIEFEEMVRMDLYSYGLVCLHVLLPFKSLQEQGLALVRHSVHTNDDWKQLLRSLRRQKQSPDLRNSYARSLMELISHEQVSQMIKDVLRSIIESTIVPEPDQRRLPLAEIRDIITGGFLDEYCPPDCTGRSFNHHYIENYSLDDEPLALLEPPPVAANSVVMNHSNHKLIELGGMLGELDDTDFAVRQNIARDVESKAKLSTCSQCRMHYGFQTALCFTIGLGGVKDRDAAQAWLTQSQKTQTDLSAAIGKVGSGYQLTGKVAASVLDSLRLGVLLHNDRIAEYELYGRLPDAESALRSEIAARERLFGENHLSAARLLQDLALVRRDQRHLEAAEMAQKRHSGILTVSLGDKHPFSIIAHICLADIMSERGRLQEAEEIQSTMIPLLSEILGDEHPDTLTSRYLLAKTLTNLGRHEEAEEIVSSVFSTRSKMLGKSHLSTVQTGVVLLTMKFDRGRFFEALELQKEIEKSLDSVLFEQPAFRVSRFIAGLYQEQGNLEEAKRVCEKALKWTGGNKALETLGVLEILAGTLVTMGNLKEAEELIQTKLETQTRGTYLEPFVKKMKADILESRDRHNEAKELRAETYNLLKANGEATKVLLNMKSLILRRKLTEETLTVELETEVLDHVRQNTETFGKTHPYTIRSRNNISSAYAMNGRPQEADEMDQASLKLIQDYHPRQLAPLLGRIAANYYQCNQFEKAETLERQALELRQQFLPQGHPELLMVMANLATTLIGMENFEEAKELMMQVVNTRSRIYSVDPKVVFTHAQAMITLGSIFFSQGDLDGAIQMYSNGTKKASEIGLDSGPVVDWKETLKNLSQVADEMQRGTSA